MTASTQRLWLIRLGRDGEYEPDALDRNLLNIGFSMVRDLSSAKSRDQVLKAVRETFPDAKPATQGNYAAPAQIKQLVNTIAEGDIVISSPTLEELAGLILKFISCELTGQQAHALSPSAGSALSLTVELPGEQISGHYHSARIHDPLRC